MELRFYNCLKQLEGLAFILLLQPPGQMGGGQILAADWPSRSCFRPVSCSVPRVQATIAPMLGWEVMPDMASTATSTMSAPAAAQANMEATPAPEVSWV